MDGSRAYINEALLKTDNRFQRTLEHQYMHNISRLRNPDIAGRISPSENADLISLDNGKKIEARNYYEERVPCHGKGHPAVADLSHLV